MTSVSVLTPSGYMEERVYLFGGLSRDLFSSLTYLRINKNKYEWVLSHPGNDTLKRFGHAACVWNGKIIIIGGGRMFIKEYKKRECLDDAYVYNPQINQWSMMKWKGAFYARRCHTASVVGKHLIVHGGIDSLEKYQSDLMVLNICPGKGGGHQWFDLKTEGKGPGNIANHTSVNILREEKYKGVYLKRCEDGEDLKVQDEGIYVFGGRDENGPKNDLYILKVGQKPCEWTQPDVKGLPPIPRYGHTATYFPKKNIIIIFGGRNDTNYGEYNESYLNDIWILELDKLVWVQWEARHKIHGVIPEGRYTHTAGVLSNSIVVFGGLGEGNYCRGDVFSFDFDDIKEEPKQEIGNEEKNDEGTDELVLPLLTQQHSEFQSKTHWRNKSQKERMNFKTVDQ